MIIREFSSSNIPLTNICLTISHCKPGKSAEIGNKENGCEKTNIGLHSSIICILLVSCYCFTQIYFKVYIMENHVCRYYCT